MIRFCNLILFLLIVQFVQVTAQSRDTIKLDLTLDDAINLANQQSLLSFRYKNMYLARYWEFRSYKAQRLPLLSLSSTPKLRPLG